MSVCPHCAARLETPVVCAACGRPLAAPEDAGPFEILGLAPTHELDLADLRKRMLRISRAIHPDFFGNAETGLRELAGRNSARVNKAFEVLADEAQRASWLVKSLGGPDEQQERAMPSAFLAEVLEWNELLEEARAETAALDPRLEGLREELRARRSAALGRVAELLATLPARGSADLSTARQHLNAVRYVDRALQDIEALRLARAASR